jgi:transcriptional regulator with XRE-family HTH domain
MLDNMSSIEDEGSSDLNARIAARVRGLRVGRGDTLDALAARSGVSRSAISMIERSATSATAVVLEKLATALSVPLASLFDGPSVLEPPSPVARGADQPVWRDPQSGYRRRNLSPPGWPSPIRIVEVEFPAGAVVSYETADREVRIYQQIWVLSGRIEVTVGTQTHRLKTGDCLAMQLDQPTMYRNDSEKGARYAVVVVSEPVPARRVS